MVKIKRIFLSLAIIILMGFTVIAKDKESEGNYQEMTFVKYNGMNENTASENILGTHKSVASVQLWHHSGNYWSLDNYKVNGNDLKFFTKTEHFYKNTGFKVIHNFKMPQKVIEHINAGGKLRIELREDR